VSRFLNRLQRRDSVVLSSPWERLHLDPVLIFMLFLLSAFGLVILYSASGQAGWLVLRQAFFLLVGFILMVLLAATGPYSLYRWTPWFYAGGLLLLVIVHFAGVEAKGARRWLDLPMLPRFQPSELMKWFVPLMVAWYLSRSNLPPELPKVLASFALVLVPTALIAQQPDLGTAVLIASAGFAVVFLSGWAWHQIILLGMLLLSATPAAWFYLLKDYQRERILVLLNPEKDTLGAGWSIMQSKVAIGSGGLFGKGLLQGTQSQLDFLPEGHTDFVIAVLAEEMGLAGVLLLLVLYAMVAVRGLLLSLEAPDSFSRLASGALVLVFIMLVLVNMAMVSGLLPVVGIPLPLLSRGGSSVIALLLAFGLVMAVCCRSERRGL